MATSEKLPKEVRNKIRKMNGDRNFTYGRLVNARSTLHFIALDNTMPIAITVRAKMLLGEVTKLENLYKDFITENTITGANFNSEGEFKP